MVAKLSSVLLLIAVLCYAQETVPDGFELWTSASLSQTEQQLRTAAASDAHHVATKRLADFSNDYFLLAHREADGVVEWHGTEADVFVVQSGTATLLVGGTMVGGQESEPHEKRGGTIEGGVRRTISPGDVIRIPARVPHQLLLGGSKSFTYFVVKVKGY